MKYAQIRAYPHSARAVQFYFDHNEPRHSEASKFVAARRTQHRLQNIHEKPAPTKHVRHADRIAQDMLDAYQHKPETRCQNQRHENDMKIHGIQ